MTLQPTFSRNEVVEILTAWRDDPDGCFCGHCGALNEWADDCGFFYCLGKPTCEACFKGAPGEEHRRLYGVGER